MIFVFCIVIIQTYFRFFIEYYVHIDNNDFSIIMIIRWIFHKPLLREQTCVLEHFKALYDARCSLLLRDLLQLGDLRLNFRSGNQVLPPQLLQLLSPQAGPSAKFYQFIVIRLGEVLVSHPVPATPFDLLTVSLGRLKVIFIIRRYPIYI